MEQQDNPFKAPEAHVADVHSSGNSGNFYSEGQKVPAGNGVSWFGSAWDLFRQNPGTWIGITLVFAIVIIVLSMIPLVNFIAPYLLMPVLAGGLMLGCQALNDGEELRFSYLFAGFQEHAGKLVLVGLFYLLALLGVVVVIGGGAAVLGLGLGMGGLLNGGGGLLFFLLAFLLGMLIGIPLAMAIWFAPALVVLQDVAPIEALKTSFFACLKNWAAFLVYGIVYLVLAIVASIPLGLGWLVLGPVILASIYAAYRDIFIVD